VAQQSAKVVIQQQWQQGIGKNAVTPKGK